MTEISKLEERFRVTIRELVKTGEARIELARRREQAVEEARKPLRLKAIGVPEDKANLALGAPKETPALRAIQAFRASDKRFLLLSGDLRTGKTVAASCWLNAAISEPSVAASAAFRIGLFIKSEWAVNAALNVNQTEWRMIIRTQNLVLDDLGRELLSEAWISKLESLIDSRRDNDVRTVITTNLPTPMLIERYGPRIGTRLAESFMAVDCKAQMGLFP